MVKICPDNFSIKVQYHLICSFKFGNADPLTKPMFHDVDHIWHFYRTDDKSR